jgi:nicotinate-nucleotide adenylyltransferase
MTIDEIELDLEQKLSKKRYKHTLAVSYIASALAMNYSIDVEAARLAGLLHDCAKWMSDDELLVYCEDHNIVINQFEQNNPGLLHGKIGASLAKNTYHIDNYEILQAITYHTTGKPSMTKLEQIIFISDYIEPNRKNLKRINMIQTTAFENLDIAMYYITEDTLTYLNSTNKVLDIKTQETYNYYKEKYLCLQNTNN